MSTQWNVVELTTDRHGLETSSVMSEHDTLSAAVNEAQRLQYDRGEEPRFGAGDRVEFIVDEVELPDDVD